MSVGSRIQALRKHCHIKNQEELSYLVGTSRQTVSSWERDVSIPEGINLVRLAKVLNTSIDYILGDTAKLPDDVVPVMDSKMSGQLDISYLLSARQTATVFVSAEKSDGHKTVRYDLPPDISAKVLPMIELLWKEIENRIG